MSVAEKEAVERAAKALWERHHHPAKHLKWEQVGARTRQDFLADAAVVLNAGVAAVAAANSETTRTTRGE